MKNYIEYPSWLHPEIIQGLPLTWYSLSYILIVVITYKLIVYQLKKEGENFKQEDLEKFYYHLIIGALLGARLASTLIYEPSGIYYQKPWLIVLPFDENWNFTGIRGMSFHGGVVGVIIAGLISLNTSFKNLKTHVLKIADYGAAAFPLSYTLGRLGNFANGELYGRVVKGGIIFPNATRFSTSIDYIRDFAREVGINILPHHSSVNLPRHASQLYEGFFEGIVIWLILWFIVRKMKRHTGFICGIYMILYGTFRFFLEYFREPDRDLGFIINLVKLENPLDFSLLNFSMGQILSLLTIIIGIIFIIVTKNISLKTKEIV